MGSKKTRGIITVKIKNHRIRLAKQNDASISKKKAQEYADWLKEKGYTGITRLIKRKNGLYDVYG